MNILVFAPHPDDDLIGCGGSIANHINNGSEVSVVYMTSGEAGSLKYTKTELAKIREAEARDAAKKIGITNTIFLNNQDGYLDYNQANLAGLIEIIREHKPDIVYLPHENDSHMDHKTTYKLVTESVNRAAGPWFQECKGTPWVTGTVLCYEVWTPLQVIGYTENITDTIDSKIEALSLHKSQLADINYSEAVKSLDRYRGIMTGKGTYCECFQVLKINKIS
jgi:N-acetylglucosamine malate deacetylase 1